MTPPEDQELEYVPVSEEPEQQHELIIRLATKAEPPVLDIKTIEVV